MSKGKPLLPPRLPYPMVLSELATIRRATIAKRSLARFGDGELRLCYEGKHIAQEASPALAAELRSLLVKDTKALICIPNTQVETRKPVMWSTYSTDQYRALYDPNRVYGSSLICRPDSAPWIDFAGYWLEVRSLWAGKDVTLVIGTRGGSLVHLKHAKSVRLVYGPERDAYREVDRVEEEIGTPEGPVLICLGPCATILAARLAEKGVHAIDLGHMGRFMPQEFLQ